jgi:hypothetical protein
MRRQEMTGPHAGGGMMCRRKFSTPVDSRCPPTRQATPAERSSPPDCALHQRFSEIFVDRRFVDKGGDFVENLARLWITPRIQDGSGCPRTNGAFRGSTALPSLTHCPPTLRRRLIASAGAVGRRIHPVHRTAPATTAIRKRSAW